MKNATGPQEGQQTSPMKFSYGGQAVIEGVMMRGAYSAAIAVRDPEGEIVVHEQPLNAALYRGPISKIPFVRGLTMLWDALGLGTRALMWSADVAVGEEEVSFTGPLGIGTVLVSLAIGIGLFFLLPAAASDFVGGVLGIEETVVLEAAVTETEVLPSEGELDAAATSGAPGGQAAAQSGSSASNALLLNLIEGLIRLALIIGYIWAIGRIGEVKRLFQYHGAEHKTINAYEAGAPLTPESVARFPREHPRCGTGFVLVVVIISVLVFSLLGRPPFIWLLVSRVALIPVIAGIAYEYLRFTATRMHNPLIRAAVAPSLALQRLTTNEPDASMLEVGIHALARVLASQAAHAPLETREAEAVTPVSG